MKARPTQPSKTFRARSPWIAAAIVFNLAACASVEDQDTDTSVMPDTSADTEAWDVPADDDAGLDTQPDPPPDDVTPGDPPVDDLAVDDVLPDDASLDSDCVPACGGRDCGPDPFCGTSCGSCTPPLVCNSLGQCVACTPDCTGRACGPDPVCSSSCGSCTPPDTCDSSGVCVPPGCPPPVPACSSGAESMEGCANARRIGRLAAAGGYSISEISCYDDWSLDEGGCGDYGPDNSFRLYMLAGETVHASVESYWDCDWTYSSWSITLKLYGNSGCSDTSCASMLVCEDSAYSQSFAYTATQDGWYIIVVDSWSAFDQGDYFLDVSLTCLDSGCGC